MGGWVMVQVAWGGAHQMPKGGVSMTDEGHTQSHTAHAGSRQPRMRREVLALGEMTWGGGGEVLKHPQS